MHDNISFRHPRMSRLQRGLWIALLAPVALAGAGCEPAYRCTRNEDCTSGGVRGVCSSRGFCRTECESDVDCPCNAFCAEPCGVCIRNDLGGPATCFAEDHFLSEEILGVCLRDPRLEVPADGSPAIDAGLRACVGTTAVSRCTRADGGGDDAGLNDAALDAPTESADTNESVDASEDAGGASDEDAP